MNNKERFLNTLSFQKVDRAPFMDFGYWTDTIRCWHEQGLPADVTDDEQVEKYIGLDRGFELCMLNGVRHWEEKAAIFRIFPKYDVVVLEETESRITYVNGEGVTIMENKEQGSMPSFLEYPVKTMGDFEKILPRLDAKNPGRKRENFKQVIEGARTTSEPVGLWLDGFYAWPRELMGMEHLSMTFYDAPELIHAINSQHTVFLKEYLDIFFSLVDIDFVCFFEDMSYKNGSFISPQMFEEFLAGYYEEVLGHLRANGVKKVLVDSDGNTLELCRSFVDLGFDGHYPLEISAGSTAQALRERYPDLSLIGGIDKRALIAGREAIDAELEKIIPLVEEGGYIPTVDHRVPPDVTLDNYKYYVDRKYGILVKHTN